MTARCKEPRVWRIPVNSVGSVGDAPILFFEVAGRRVFQTTVPGTDAPGTDVWRAAVSRWGPPVALLGVQPYRGTDDPAVPGVALAVDVFDGNGVSLGSWAPLDPGADVLPVRIPDPTGLGWQVRVTGTAALPFTAVFEFHERPCSPCSCGGSKCPD